MPFKIINPGAVKYLFCDDLLVYRRRATSEVKIGNVSLGGTFPIRIQSMTNTDTSNTSETVKQIVGIAREGADFVRLTVPGTKDAENLLHIMAELEKHHCLIPIVADIHFNPKLARLAAVVVDKVRINPGNFIDRKFSKAIDFTEAEYQKEIDRLKKELTELIVLCRKHNTALRIGTNHGSLSDRIMNRFGDSPEGMAESAMEFLRICAEEKFMNVVVSMKASNTRIMVYASRLLLQKMETEGMHFPLHLGVTEAGEGEDGRIKSAVGIGALLADGIGETIRVSLTEDPEFEIPVAKKLVNYFMERENHPAISPFGTFPINPFIYSKRETLQAENVGGDNVPVVLFSLKDEISKEKLKTIGWQLLDNGKWFFADQSPDYLIVNSWPEKFPYPEGKRIVCEKSRNEKKYFSIVGFADWHRFNSSFDKMQFVIVNCTQLHEAAIEELKKYPKVVIVLETENINGYADQRAAVFRLMNSRCYNPVIFKRRYAEDLQENLQLKSAADFGGLFIDGLGEGIWLDNIGSIGNNEIVSTAFGILQASRVRTSKTEYISCPSCGRTLFDLQLTTRKIRERTSHLKGLKIGVMGCIVNGPGEMADADYGYVGTGLQRVTLYKGQQVVKRNIPESDAVEQLLDLIKAHGDWIEP